MIGRRSIVVLVVLGVQATAACDAGDPGGGTSATQGRFVEARGVPQLYAIAFADEEIAPDGTQRALSQPRRVESWIWVGGPTRRATFDSGFFVGEEEISTTLTTAPTPSVGPLDFHYGMGPADVAALVGDGLVEETADLGGAELRVLRREGAAGTSPMSFGFLDGRLTAVAVGFAMMP